MTYRYTFCLTFFCILLINQKINTSSSSTPYIPETPPELSPVPVPPEPSSLKRPRTPNPEPISLCKTGAMSLHEFTHQEEQKCHQRCQSVVKSFCALIGINPIIFQQIREQVIYHKTTTDDQYPLSNHGIETILPEKRVREYALRTIFRYYGVHHSHILVHTAEQSSENGILKIDNAILHINPTLYNLSEDEQSAHLLRAIFHLKNNDSETLDTINYLLERIKENPDVVDKAKELIIEFRSSCYQRACAQALLTIASDPYHPLPTTINKALELYKKLEESPLRLNTLAQELQNFNQSQPSLSSENPTNSKAQLQKLQRIIEAWLADTTRPKHNSPEHLPNCKEIYNQRTNTAEENRTLNAWIASMQNQ